MYCWLRLGGSSSRSSWLIGRSSAASRVSSRAFGLAVIQRMALNGASTLLIASTSGRSCAETEPSGPASRAWIRSASTQNAQRPPP
jgi:hypothetical protein